MLVLLQHDQYLYNQCTKIAECCQAMFKQSDAEFFNEYIYRQVTIILLSYVAILLTRYYDLTMINYIYLKQL